MAFARRIFLFLALNALVILTLSTLMQVLGVQPYLTRSGIDYQSLLWFCGIWGMGGAFISLALSRIIAKWSMGVRLVDAQDLDPSHRALVATVERLAQRAGLPNTPEVGIFDSPEVNAFATGPTRSRALVAVSTGLLQAMRPDEVEGVLGHELAHVANGDMVTMTLLQGVVNAFAMFLSRAIAFAAAQALRGDRDERNERPSMANYGTQMVIQFALEMVFMLLGSILVAWFSRQREFRADAGGAQIAGRDRMVRALQRLAENYERVDPRPQASAVQTLKISAHPRGLGALFASHPPLEDRIQALRMGIS